MTLGRKITFNEARNILAIMFYGTEEGKKINRVLNDVDDNPWHTGTPTEEGWYVLKFNNTKRPYEIAKWDGSHFVMVRPLHAIVVYCDAENVPMWQKIQDEPKERTT